MAAHSLVQTVWTPHPRSPAIKQFTTLLERRDERWVWVDDLQRAAWIVIDTTSSQRLQLDDIATLAGLKRRKIALANKLTDLPDNGWVFCRAPVTESGVALIVGHLLRLEIDVPGAALAPSQIKPSARTQTERPVPRQSVADHREAPWVGNHLRLRRWPNLSRYHDPQMRLLEATRRMLSRYVHHAELADFVGDVQMLDRLLADAHRGGTLQIRDNFEPLPSEFKRHSADAAAPSLLQRFLKKFQ